MAGLLLSSCCLQPPSPPLSCLWFLLIQFMSFLYFIVAWHWIHFLSIHQHSLFVVALDLRPLNDALTIQPTNHFPCPQQNSLPLRPLDHQTIACFLNTIQLFHCVVCLFVCFFHCACFLLGRLFMVLFFPNLRLSASTARLCFVFFSVVVVVVLANV